MESWGSVLQLYSFLCHSHLAPMSNLCSARRTQIKEVFMGLSVAGLA